MAETVGLLDKYSGSGDVSQVDRKEQTTHHDVLLFKPDWASYQATRGAAAHLADLVAGAPAAEVKETLQGKTQKLQACMEALSVQEEKPVQWMLTFLYDLLREDSSCYGLFEDAMKNKVDFYKPLMSVLEKRKGELYIHNKAAWLLSALMGYYPSFFDEAKVKEFLSFLLQTSEPAGSDAAVGTLEAIVNLLKSDELRRAVWTHQGVAEHVFGIQVKTAQSHSLYRCVFAIWMLSFDPAIAEELKGQRVVARIRDMLAVSRAEKVVRLCLTVLRTLVGHKPFVEEIVELNVLDAVQALEYEKWRDAELYDDIREVAQLISNEIHEVSNFERYERDLNTGKLTWGFTHTSKFWGENVMKFEQNDFGAMRKLALLLLNEDTDPTTLAVACHDVGEFVALHPLGKKKVNQLGIKDRVMHLMGSDGDDMREVRREALLCCQKIMLNKWQDMDKANK